MMWVVILVGVLLMFQFFKGMSAGSEEIAFSDFLDQIAAGKISKVLIKGEEIYVSTSQKADEKAAGPRYDKYTYNPGYDDLIKDGVSIGGAWKTFLEKGAELAGNKIDSLVIGAPLTFRSTDELLKAASTMITKQIRLLPVVDDGKLVGTISRGDLCKAVLGG